MVFSYQSQKKRSASPTTFSLLFRPNAVDICSYFTHCSNGSNKCLKDTNLKMGQRYASFPAISVNTYQA